MTDNKVSKRIKAKKNKTTNNIPALDTESQKDREYYSHLKNKDNVKIEKSGSHLLTYLIVGIVILSLLVMAGFFSKELNNNSKSNDYQVRNQNMSPDEIRAEVTLYSSPDCSCCHQYVSYLQDNKIYVNFIRTENFTDIKEQLNIPASLRSCHTVLWGDYFTEGHIPMEAINKLLAEKPAFDGITLPGMPGGSPGMGGSKSGSFDIIALNNGTSLGTYVSI